MKRNLLIDADFNVVDGNSEFFELIDDEEPEMVDGGGEFSSS